MVDAADIAWGRACLDALPPDERRRLDELVALAIVRTGTPPTIDHLDVERLNLAERMEMATILLNVDTLLGMKCMRSEEHDYWPHLDQAIDLLRRAGDRLEANRRDIASAIWASRAARANNALAEGAKAFAHAEALAAAQRDAFAQTKPLGDAIQAWIDRRKAGVGVAINRSSPGVH